MRTLSTDNGQLFNGKKHYISALAFVLGLIVVAISASISPVENRLSFVSLLSATGIASGIFGILLGFLFGIPKLNKNYSPTENYASTQQYETNTNLEEISDWLTKIIVGVSLTQLTKIPQFMSRVGDFVLSYHACHYGCLFAKPLVISLVVYFLICGFLVGYFYTRVWLPKLFSLSERNSQLEATNKLWIQGYKQHEAYDTDTTGDIPAGDMLKSVAGNTTAIPGKIKSLTLPETNMIKLILDNNNSYTLPAQFTNVDELSALKILIDKGIVGYLHGNTVAGGNVVTVSDEEVKQYFGTGSNKGETN